MPKIKKENIRVNHNDVSRYFDIDIMYTSDQLFYAVIPAEFNEAFDHFEEEELRKFSASKIYKSRLNREDFKRIVSNNTESGCVDSMRDMLRALLDKTIIKRDVIIIFYNPSSRTQYGSLEHNKEHGQIGLQIALTYCVETTSGSKKSYTFSHHDHFGERYKKFSVWGNYCTVIDDTPTNRMFLENLYSAVKTLNNKLAEFTSTPAKILELISSGQKLLE